MFQYTFICLVPAIDVLEYEITLSNKQAIFLKN
jgi:hypothetical protein